MINGVVSAISLKCYSCASNTATSCPANNAIDCPESSRYCATTSTDAGQGTVGDINFHFMS